MKRSDFDIAVGIAERMDKLEHTIFKLQEITNKNSYAIIASDYPHHKLDEETPLQYIVKLNSGEMATEVFVQDILEYYINTLNLELNELRKSFDDIVDKI